MSFSTNSIHVPKNFEEWTDWFSHQPTVTRNKGTKKLGCNDKILRRDGEFVFEFHGHGIARYTPEHTRLYTHGWGSSQSTRVRLNNLTRAGIYRLGCLDPRHTKLRVNGLPFFEGIRILPNGNIHPEDVRPDVVTKKRPEVVKAYMRLFRQIKNSLRTRQEIGEFNDAAHYRYPDYHTLRRVIALYAEGKTFIPHEWVPSLLAIRQGCSFDENVNAARDALRNEYLRNNSGFYDEEVQNATR